MPIRSCAQTLLRALFILLFGGIFTLIQRSANQWDYLVFTQRWPQAVCIDINETKPENGCVMPENVKSWTVHGVWPNADGRRGPSYCNDSWPFREDKIIDLESKLEMYWPNLIGRTEKSSFWKHEWCKHGTCAASLPDLSSEHKYFAAGLQLQQRFNLIEIFGDKGLHPSANATYPFQRFRDVLRTYTKTTTKIFCIIAKSKTVQLIIQIEICLNKSFTVIDCEVSGRRASGNPKYLRRRRDVVDTKWDGIPYNPDYEECLEDVPVLYLPITSDKYYL